MMNKFGLKKWLIVLVAFFGFASMGSAQKIDLGFHFGNSPYSFSALGGNLDLAFSNTLSLRFDLDLALGTGGGGNVAVAFGIDANLLFSFPLSPTGSSLYVGPGIFLGVVGGNATFGLGALLGIEIQLAPKVGYFVETSPLLIAFTNPVQFSLPSALFRTGLKFRL
jgi:hypothetical protein